MQQTINTVIPTSSLRFNIVKEDTVCTKILTHVAVADLLMILVTYLPKLVTAYARRWVLGPVICFATAALGPIPGNIAFLIFLGSIAKVSYFSIDCLTKTLTRIASSEEYLAGLAEILLLTFLSCYKFGTLCFPLQMQTSQNR